MASSFDETRNRPWQGWEKLLPYIPSQPLSVLDVGCGNGRFGVFLNEHFTLHYTGLDSNPYLLEQAEQALQSIPHNIQQVDIVEAWELDQTFDLIVLFGVLHHIPAFDNRRKLLQKLHRMLKPDGILAITFWLFYEQARFRQRLIDWQDPQVPEAYHHLDIEPNDYLLDWRRDTTALRYCHYVDQAEGAKLTADINIIADYEADTANRYVLVRKG